MNARSMPLLYIAAAAVVGSAGAQPVAERSDYPAIVCTAEAGGPFVVRAKAALTRTKVDNELRYQLRVKGQNYEWRFITNDDKSTTILGPGFLIGRLVEAPRREKALPSPRGPINAAEGTYPTSLRQSLDVNGEVRESGPAIRLWVGRGTECPTS